NISAVHDSRITDTGVTISDAYRTNRRISYVIGVLRLLTTIMIQAIVWFSWIIVITDLTNVFTTLISLKYIYIMKNLYLVCLLCIYIIVSVLNTWTTIRRYLLLNDSTNVQYLATVRSNQGTRSDYLSILTCIIVGIIFNIIFNLLDIQHAQ
ncbi:unnamed protein product, partial [Rotaria sp. Silwood2]